MGNGGPGHHGAEIGHVSIIGGMVWGRARRVRDWRRTRLGRRIGVPRSYEGETECGSNLGRRGECRKQLGCEIWSSGIDSLHVIEYDVTKGVVWRQRVSIYLKVSDTGQVSDLIWMWKLSNLQNFGQKDCRSYSWSPLDRCQVSEPKSFWKMIFSLCVVLAVSLKKSCSTFSGQVRQISAYHLAERFKSWNLTHFY